MLLYLVQGYGKFFFQGVVVDRCGLFFSSKVDQMQDIVTGNPAVIKIVVHFNRWIIENVLTLFLASTLWFPAGLLAVHYLYKIVYSNIDVWKYECSTYAATIPSWLMKRSVSSHTSLCYPIVSNVSLYLVCFILLLYRGQKGQSSLRELLQPLVEGVLNDKNLSINTNPLEVYKAWINQVESETGQARYSLT